MKIILTILSIWVYTANATNYYVANAGSNSNNGTSVGTPFQTIAKVISVAVSGDSIFLNKGDSWNEKLTVPGANIYVGYYGTGINPLITGFKTASMTSIGGNLYTATLTDGVVNQNTIVINGSIRAKARYPKTGSGSFYGTIGTNKVKLGTGFGTSYISGLNYVGGQFVYRGQNWFTDVFKITAQSVDTLTLDHAFTITSGANYFVQNIDSSAVINQQNDWVYDSTSKVLTVYSTSAPTVQYSNIDTVVYMNHHNGVTISGISITGSNKLGIGVDTSNNVTIQNCYLNNNGDHAITALHSSGTTVKKDTILNSLNVGASFYNYSAHTLFDSNYINNTSLLIGMATGNFAYVGFLLWGDSSTITNNRFDTSGYIPLMFTSLNSTVQYNYITNFCSIESDGGGIYGYNGITGTQILNNIVLNGYGTYNNVLAPCIYLDQGSSGAIVTGNTCSNSNIYGIFLHNSNSNTIRSNTIVDSIGTALGIEGTSNSSHQNILYGKSVGFPVYYNYAPVTTDLSDSSYFLFPSSQTNNVLVGGVSNYTFTGWQNYSGFDAHTKTMPTGITTDAGVLYINPTKIDSIITLDRNKIDATGVAHSGTVTLHAFQSIILFNAIGSGHYRIGGLNFN